MITLTDTDVVRLLRKNNQITAKEIAGLLGISLRHSERLITSLKQKGMIQRVGSNKNEYWEIIVK
jgi:predicted HTH transcriptional regulator